jgi:RNA polymerase primary sigma factor
MTNEQIVLRIRAGIDVAENMLTLYQQNRGMIEKLAGKYSSMAEKEDLMQEGYIGLCNAVNHWDPDGGANFLTYAIFWMKQKMRRYIEDCGNVVRIPVNEQQKQREYRKVVTAFEAQIGRKPTDRELCHYLGVDRETLARMQNRTGMCKIASLDSYAGDEEDTPLSDMIPGQEDVEGSVLDEIQQEELKAVIWSLVDSLPGQQPDVIRMRYQEGKTLKETGEQIGKSLNYARQLEQAGMRELRKPHIAWKLRPFLYDDVIRNEGMHGIGVGTFKRTWTSATERVALERV